MRKLFDIHINDKPFPVFSIDGKEHLYGKHNGCPETWWLDYTYDVEGNYIPLEENRLLMEFKCFEEERNLIPYIDKGVQRICWEVIYKQSNYMRHKWDEYDLRGTGGCTLRANGRDVYKFRNSDLHSAMTQVQYLTEKILSHPYNFFKPEEDDGRKIYFRSLPAFVRIGYEVGEIRIQPDYSMISKEKWWKIHDLFQSRKYESDDSIFYDDDDEPDDDDLQYEMMDMINWGDVLNDGQIWWFRD